MKLNRRETNQICHYDQLIRIIQILLPDMTLTAIRVRRIISLLTNHYEFDDPTYLAFKYPENIYGIQINSACNEDIEIDIASIDEMYNAGYMLWCSYYGKPYMKNIVYYIDGSYKICMMVNKSGEICEHMFIHRLPSSLFHSKIEPSHIRHKSMVIDLHKYAINIYKPSFIVSSPVPFMHNFFEALVDEGVIEPVIDIGIKRRIAAVRLCFNTIREHTYTAMYRVLSV